MNGAQDMGGKMGFGPVQPEVDEPYFHSRWEARVLALTLAMGATGMWNIDKSRHARETINPADYLNWSYYHIWLAGLEKLLLDSTLVSADELRTGTINAPPSPIRTKLMAEDVTNVLSKGGPASRQSDTIAAFKVGNTVSTVNINPEGHTRLAGYLRSRTGTIERVHTTHVFPDTNAHARGENPQWLYTVKFSARELWGDEARHGDFVYADLFEPYLVPAK